MRGTRNWENKEKTTSGGMRGEQRFQSPHRTGETFGIPIQWATGKLGGKRLNLLKPFSRLEEERRHWTPLGF